MGIKSILMGLFVVSGAAVFFISADSACNQEAVIRSGATMALGGVIVENKQDSLILVCDTPVKKNLISFVIIKDGIRVGGVAEKANVSFISFMGD